MRRTLLFFALMISFASAASPTSRGPTNPRSREEHRYIAFDSRSIAMRRKLG
jgi:hypothetical protein